MTWLGVGQRRGARAQRRPVGDAAEGHRSRSGRRPRARAAAVRDRDARRPARRRARPGHRRDRRRLRRLARHLGLDPGRSASGSWPSTGSPPTTPSWWRSATSARDRERRQGPGRVPLRPATRPRSREYLRDPSERSLRVAYELARDAVSRQLSVLDLAVAHQEALLVGAGRRLRTPRRRSGSRARPVTSSSRACPRSRWSSAGFSEAREAARARTSPDRDVAPAVDLPRRRLARPRRLRLARGDAAAGRRAGARARGRRVLRGDGRRRRAGRGPRRPPPTPRPTGAGPASCGGSTCSRSTGCIRASGGSVRLGRRRARRNAAFPATAAIDRPSRDGSPHR